jgi:hypothetical protein
VVLDYALSFYIMGKCGWCGQNYDCDAVSETFDILYSAAAI